MIQNLLKVIHQIRQNILIKVLATIIASTYILLTPLSIIDEIQPENFGLGFFKYWGYQKIYEDLGQEQAFKCIKIIEDSNYEDLIKAMTQVESMWTNVVSDGGSGYMQLTVSTAQSYDHSIKRRRDLLDPEKNFIIASMILEDLFNKFDSDTSKILYSYNVVTGDEYCRKVLHHLNKLTD